jgi:DNA polymerase-4
MFRHGIMNLKWAAGASWHRHRSADFQVCCIAGFQTRKLCDSQRLADLEVGDTAGLETCATSRRGWSNGGSVKMRRSSRWPTFSLPTNEDERAGERRFFDWISRRQNVHAPGQPLANPFCDNDPDIRVGVDRRSFWETLRNAGVAESGTAVLQDRTEFVSKPDKIRILHVDGDSFFASCEIAMDSKLQGQPVWVGGGRRGDGIVIAANRQAKKFGIKTGMACFDARRLCPKGVLCRPHYDEYRRLSQDMFRILEEYSPTLVPISIDEGFLDFSTMDHYVWRNGTPEKYVKEIRDRILREVKLPVSAGLANSSPLAKLATDAAKPGFIEVPAGSEKEFLKDRSVRELSGVASRRQRALASIGARTFGDVAKLPSMLLRQKFGIWGQQLWLFANGLWNEPLLLEIKDRATISSNTTLPYDEPDYEAALTFTLSEATRLAGQLRREQLQARELGLTIRFNDFSEAGGGHRFHAPQFLNSVINRTLEGVFRAIVSDQAKPVRQIRIAFWNLSRLDTQPTLWGETDEERWGALDEATHKLNQQLNKTAVMTGAQFALREMEESFRNPRAKCPFVPQREMVKKLWGTDADPLAHKGEWEKRLAKVSKQHHFKD